MSKTNPKLPAFRRFAAAGLASLLPVAGAFAQEEEDDDVFTLTPFEVEAEEDAGYRATNTLAGTRMRMNLEDVGSSVSVFTEQLMEDLNAVDNESLLAYGLGTEVGGARGNFVNPETDGSENENLFEPQANNRVRGLTSADNTRNFFKSDVPWNGYNVSRIDVQRGPNSVLFGLGSPAGIINNTTTSAGFVNEGELQLRYDQFGSLRASLDYNQVLLEDELSIRLSLLRDSQEFRQEPAFEDDERIYASVVYQPKLLNTESITTRFSANFEHGDIEANRPRFVIPEDNVSPFFLPPDENGFLGPDFANDGKYGPSSPITGLNGQTVNQIEDSVFISDNPWVNNAPGTARPTLIFDARNPGSFRAIEDGLNARGSFLIRSSGEEEAVVVNSGFVDPFSGNFQQEVDEDALRGLDTQQTARKGRVADDNFPFTGRWRTPSFSSPEQFDFFNNLIDGNSKLEQQEFDVFEFQARNTFLNNRLGYQLSYFDQEMDLRQDAFLGDISQFQPRVMVDIGELSSLTDDLGNPQPNEFAGRPFVEFELRQDSFLESRERDTRQAQLFATLDSSDFMDEGMATRLLGRHDFTALFKNRRLTQFGRRFEPAAFGEDALRQRGGIFPSEDDPDPGRGSRRALLAESFGSYASNVRVYLEALGPNLTQIQPFSVELPSGPVTVEGFRANPKPGFTAEDALAEWVTPFPSGSEEGGFEIERQANNPANYQGTAEVGTFQFIKATDSREALEFLTNRRTFDEEDIDTTALVWQGTFWEGAVVGMYGWREDDATNVTLVHEFDQDVDDRSPEEVAEDSGFPVDTVLGRTEGPFFDPDSEFRREVSESFESRNWSVKANVTKLFFDATGMDREWLPFDVSILFNEGEVQNPQPGRRDILLNELAPSSGRTIDRSVVLSSRDGNYSLRITKFDTTQRNANAGNAAATQNWRIEQVLDFGTEVGRVWIDEERAVWKDATLDDLDPARRQEVIDGGFDSVFEYGQFLAEAWRDLEVDLFNGIPETRVWARNIARRGFVPGESLFQPDVLFPDDTSFVEDRTSFGLEFEFFAQPTENWNVTVNASKVQTVRSRIFSESVGEVLDFIIDRMAGPAGDMPLWGPNGQKARTRLAPFTGELASNRALLGTPTDEIRKWRVNLITNYDFTEGILDGFGVGGAFRHESDQTFGFKPFLADPATGERLDSPQPGSEIRFDLDQPFTDEPRQTFDVWFKYQRQLTDRIDWRVQLNFFNVFNDRGAVPLWRNPDGSTGTRGIREGRSWQITNTFEF